MSIKSVIRAPGPRLCGVVLVLGGILPQAVAAATGSCSAEKQLLNRARAELFATDFLAKLRLNGKEARQLMPILDEACRAFVAGYEQRARLQPQMVDTFSSFLDEAKRDEGFSPNVERRTARLNHRAKEALEAYDAFIIELEEDVKPLLTGSQAALADTYRPDVRALFSGSERPRQKQFRNPQRRPVRQAAYRHARAGQGLENLEAELREIHESAHPSSGNLGQYLLHPAAAGNLCTLAGQEPSATVREAQGIWREGTRTYPLQRCLEDVSKIQALREEINLWNLVNGLHLTLDQVKGIGWCAAQATKARPSRFSPDQMSKDQMRGAYATLMAAKRDIERYGYVAPRTASRFHQQMTQLRNVRSRGSRHSRVGDGASHVFALEQEVNRLLLPSQREVLADYKPCLIPPKNLKNPVRAGQANDSSIQEHLLTRVRRIDSNHWPRVADEVLKREQKHLGGYDEATAQARRRLLLEVFAEAADLEDTDFELAKQDLAQRIQPTDRRTELHKQLDEQRFALHKPGKTAHFLLCDGMVPVLAYRQAQLKKTPASAKVDIRKGPLAENCDKGCALKD